MTELRIVFLIYIIMTALRVVFLTYKVLYYTTSESNLKKNNNLTLKWLEL